MLWILRRFVSLGVLVVTRVALAGPPYTTPTHHKSDLSVKAVASGSVKVVAKALKGAKANEFTYSTDGGKSWIGVPTSTKASTTITGLVPGVTVTYRHRPITKNGPGDWSQPVIAVVT